MFFSCLSGPALLALLAAAPPWTVDSPAAAANDARLGIGAAYFFESQESWEMDGPVAQLPLGLSCFRLTDGIRGFPTLTLEAGSVGISSSGRSGRGALFGAKLGANASLCGSCPWFAGLSYRYRTLPEVRASDRVASLSFHLRGHDRAPHRSQADPLLPAARGRPAGEAQEPAPAGFRHPAGGHRRDHPLLLRRERLPRQPRRLDHSPPLCGQGRLRHGSGHRRLEPAAGL